MQIPVLQGVYTDEQADFRTAYPRNLVPTPKNTGISQGYLRPAEGIVAFGPGGGQGEDQGEDRGGINWNGSCYRVMGTRLVRVEADGAVSGLADVPAGGQVTFDYSFDRLAIAVSGNLYYYDGSTLTQVTDADLGTVVDFIWVDGYFMSTDGTYLIVTELNDPLSVNPLKYGSSEADPDPIKAVLKLRNEPHALNRYTVEVFDNVGGENFPFQRVEGAQLQRGSVGTHSCCVFVMGSEQAVEVVAFLGSGRNESMAIWAGLNGTSIKLSTREIDQLLDNYTEAQLATAIMETRIDKGRRLLYLHLPDQTLVYDGVASAITKEPVWFVLTTSITGLGQYRARNFVRAYDKWLVGDPIGNGAIGYFSDEVSSHWGELNGWEFSTLILYNEGRRVIFHELELVCLEGRVAADADPTIWTSYSTDGETWSTERGIRSGRRGERNKRLTWLQQGTMEHWRVQKFRGLSDSHLSIARLEARVEGLA
jgi:hypothetical protein